MASRRRRRKTIGKVVSDVERRVRVVEKSPGAKRLKRNVVTAEKIQYRTVVAKNIVVDGVTPNEVSFGTTIVSDTQPTDYLKEGTTWVDPGTGAAAVYDPATEAFVDLTAVDLTARASADGKNTIYRQNSQPSGGTYVTGDTWFDIDDDNKIYRYDGTSWVGFTLGDNALASISANKITAGTIDARVITVSYIDAGEITVGKLSTDMIDSGTISATITMTSPTLTSGVISTNTVTSFSAVSTGNPRVTLASQYLSQATSGIGIVIDTGAGSAPGGINANANLAGNQSTMSIYTQTHGGGSGVITLTSGPSGTSGYAAIGVAGGTNLNNILITNTYAQLYTGSTPSLYALRNIKCVDSFSAGSDSTGTNGDVVLVYTP